MKRIKEFLFTPDDYDGLRWIDVIYSCIFVVGGGFLFPLFLMKMFGG